MCQDGLVHIAQAILPNATAEIASLVAEITAAAEKEEEEPQELSKNDGLVIYRGTIITMAGGKFSPAESMAVRGDTIIAVGTEDDVKQAISSQSINNVTERDLGTKCILSGFVEPHVHLLASAMVANLSSPSAPMIDMTYPAVQTRDSAIKKIQDAPQYNKGAWIIGFGYDPSLVDAHEEFTLTELDAVAKNNPVYIINQSGHLAYTGTGKTLTGVVKEGAVGAMAAYLPKTLALEMINNTRSTLAGWTRTGCTTVFDAGLGSIRGFWDVETIAGLISVGHNFPRFRGALAIQTIQDDIPKFISDHSVPWKQGRVTVQGIKFWLDGSTQGFTAAVSEPYYTPPPRQQPVCGTLNYPDDDDEKKLLGYVEQLAKAGWQMVMHVNGGRAVDQALRVLCTVSGSGMMHRLEHVTADITVAQLTKAKETGLGVSHLVAHVRKWGRAFKGWVLGPVRGPNIDPVRDDVEVGVTYSFHSDSPVSEVEPLQYVDTAVTRKMDDGHGGTEVLGEDQTVGLEDALCGITCNPAKELGMLEDVGSLEVGKKADFVILAVDPRGVDDGDVKEKCVVCETWVGGVRVYQASE
ncbi:amidohydrolase family-domain-containing protein [Apodospora peruviana]|uniref:Amidohydrolase family-domain-containing protein n=1 Tax=Apodospora peruviana TaxID=516989 RepID=A0AAE0I0C7_9PEZI|nr:amidohydrolase family-domain-containing protein [Apodospora peruviana]